MRPRYLFILMIVVASVTLGEINSNDVFMDDALYSMKMDQSIQDIMDDVDSEEGRFFDYDRGAAFNTSVAFTIPLFSFTLPGALETSETGLDSNSFGVLAFVSLFLLGGLAVAIYTTSQGANADAGRKGGEIYFDNSYFSGRLLNNVYDSIDGLSDAFDVNSCMKLAVCSAHAERQKYGLLSLPFQFFFPAPMMDSGKDADLSAYEQAAAYGFRNEDECYFEFPCIVHPLDTIMYLKDYFLR